jgi:hypothetical protein
MYSIAVPVKTHDILLRRLPRLTSLLILTGVFCAIRIFPGIYLNRIFCFLPFIRILSGKLMKP